ncbi:hypothetical protein BEI_1388 [Halomonas beimenensis]|uniref:Uncharacterized protein n=1 Tax=Halomonas beimenensis TaxID=475662 RepID=A0A291P667_9GAMM|nr:hypothetical protein BEI_1388 [Halomonas beimenensis]
MVREAVAYNALLNPIAKALSTLERHAEQVVRRRHSGLTNVRAWKA